MKSSFFIRVAVASIYFTHSVALAHTAECDANLIAPEQFSEYLNGLETETIIPIAVSALTDQAQIEEFLTALASPPEAPTPPNLLADVGTVTAKQKSAFQFIVSVGTLNLFASGISAASLGYGFESFTVAVTSFLLFTGASSLLLYVLASLKPQTRFLALHKVRGWLRFPQRTVASRLRPVYKASQPLVVRIPLNLNLGIGAGIDNLPLQLTHQADIRFLAETSGMVFRPNPYESLLVPGSIDLLYQPGERPKLLTFLTIDPRYRSQLYNLKIHGYDATHIVNSVFGQR